MASVSEKKAEERVRASNVKKGVERVERRSGSGSNGAPKKGGHGGKFTWGGDRSRDLNDFTPALDHNDPNYDQDD